ncbi:MAG: replicative DNA helicase (plasmid) [Candidatus Algichlamydia australiensis]|nr:replicative DNA helicase [Chlamydiales bacterium]
MGKQLVFASEESERIILGRMLNDERDRDFSFEHLSVEKFFYTQHKQLFELISQLKKKNISVTTVTLIEELKDPELAKKVGHMSFITGLMNLAPSPVLLEDYIQIVKDNWAKREVASTINHLNTSLKNDASFNIESVLSSLPKKLESISRSLVSRHSVSFTEISRGGEKSFIDEYAFRRKYFQENNKPFVDGVSTGYLDVDSMLGGFLNSNLIILASRPGMGKTALALNFSKKVAEKHPVGFISLEMTANQLYERILSMETGISGSRIREGKTSDLEWGKLKEAEKEVSKLPIFVAEGCHELKEICSKARFLKKEMGIQFLIIDYVQLMSAKGENRLAEVSAITRSLKNLSIELHIPILGLAQLSRKVEERADHRPFLSDLRESASLEHDADSVLFLLRQDYYDKDAGPGKAELIIAKNRHGQTGDVALSFIHESGNFLDYTGEDTFYDQGF